ncbi:MAG TPA: ATP-binding protein [Nitrospiraceae bacterium]|nr:ATP-binding protein [Nitrospiraceae bacterium]
MQSSHPDTSPAPDATNTGPNGDLAKPPRAGQANGSRLLTAFQRWSIERRVLVGFGLVFAGVLIISAVSYRNMTVLLQNTHQDQRSRDLIELLIGMGASLDESENGHRRYLVTGDESYLKAFHAVNERIPEYIRYVRELTQDIPEQRQHVDLLNRLIEKQMEAERKAIELRTKTGFEAVRNIALAGVAKAELEEFHHIQGQMEHDENRAMHRRAVQSAAITRNTIGLLAIGLFLLFVLLASVYYLIRHDITERRRVATELKRRGELLEAANKELEAFSYSVSHDLRAPLRHIDGYAAMLQKSALSQLDEKSRRYLHTISESATRMGQLIDDLLVFSRMGRQEMLQTTVNLEQLVKSVLHDLRHDTQNREISWTIGALPEVKGDPAMLRQVFSNLISNAIKFTNTRPLAKIEVGSDDRNPAETVVYVRDNGVGFDMQYAAKLFGVFQRLHRADEFEGTGIGLANVRRIIHRHGGRTWAESRLDQGAIFYFSLPRTREST